MARIPDEDIERIKRETDLAALVRTRGIELKKHGSGNLIGVCPFHADQEPSFIVTPGKGLFHCMGCGAAGNAIQFIERFDGVSFRHAFELLNAGKPAFIAPAESALKRTSVQRLETPFDPDEDDASLFASVVDYYHERLLKTPDALDYLRSRGLYDEEAITTFRFGFVDRTFGLRLPAKNRQKGATLRNRLQKLGILRASGHEHFTGSLVVPIFNEHGEVVEMYGRKISNRQFKGTPLHLYLPGPHAGIWNPAALNESDVILCEAPLDALTFWVNNMRNVTFIYGTEGFPDYLLDALVTHRVKTVRLAYDNDTAGNRAVVRDAERLTAKGIEVHRIKFPFGMDANEYACKYTPAAKALSMAVKSAVWLGVGGDGKCRMENDECNISAPTQPATPEPRAEARAPSSLLAASSLAAVLSCEALEHSSLGEGGLAKQEAANKNRQPEPSGAEARVSEKIPLEKEGDYYTLELGPRGYRVGGLQRNQSLDVLKINLRLRVGESFHVDSLDLLRDGDRRRFIERAAEECRLEKTLLKSDLGKLLFALEDAQQARLAAAAEPSGPVVPELPADEYEEALAFLTAPNLVDRIGEAFDVCGLVGEETNRLAAYLACTSRKLSRPLAVIVQSSSAAGKTTLMEAVLAMFPVHEQVKYSAMTGQSLYYLGETDLKHKILAIVEEEGAEKASYALKLLQSEGELTIASTGKDPHTGRMETQEYHVQGPVMIFLTTTAIDIDEELQNRCLTLSVDESKEQTERIHVRQRKARTLAGLVGREKMKDTLRVLRNVQRLIEPLAVVNDFAENLTFLSSSTRTRRDHEKYLTLIDAIALLHQHQRPVENRTVNGREIRFIRAIAEDITLANQLVPELLGRSLDELPPQTRRLLGVLRNLVQSRCEAETVEPRYAIFTRRDVCRASGWSYAQVRRHLDRLQDVEYVAVRFGRLGGAVAYELLDITAANELTPIEDLLTPPCRGEGATRLSVLESVANVEVDPQSEMNKPELLNAGRS